MNTAAVHCSAALLKTARRMGTQSMKLLRMAPGSRSPRRSMLSKSSIASSCTSSLAAVLSFNHVQIAFPMTCTARARQPVDAAHADGHVASGLQYCETYQPEAAERLWRCQP